MTDKELIELAAKAMHSPENYSNAAYMQGWYSNWNPLESDGDALRLAVDLHMHVMTRGAYADTDPYAETRRAIVMAAAEIGRQE